MIPFAFYVLGLLLSTVAALFFMLVIGYFLEPRKGRIYTALSYLTFLITSAMVIQIGDAFNILATLPIFLACLLFCYRGSIFARFSIAIILFSLAMSFNALLYSYIERYLISLTHLFRTAFWLAIYLLVRRIVPHSRPALSRKMWLSIDALAVLPFAVTVVSVLAGGYRSEGRQDMSNLLLAFALFASVALLFLVMVFVRQDELERAQMLWAMQGQYYENLEREQLQVRRLRHDMANHLQTMSGLPDEAMRTYLSELITSPAMHSGRRYCENDVVNAVLQSKLILCEENNIKAETTAALPSTLPIAEVDLCAVFANALDNAIEACRKLPEHQRRLSLKARADKGLFMLELQNTAPSAPEPHLFETSKPDKQNHGFGLASIREITDRYHGSLELSHSGATFTLLLSIPLSA